MHFMLKTVTVKNACVPILEIINGSIISVLSSGGNRVALSQFELYEVSKFDQNFPVLT